MPTKEHTKENKSVTKEDSTVTVTSDHTITITPDNPLYDTYAQMFATYGTSTLDPYYYTIGSNNDDRKTEAVKPADVPYEEHCRLEHENAVLKEIIIDLNKKIYNLERKLEHGKNR